MSNPQPRDRRRGIDRKRAGDMLKWIIRFRPIQLLKEDSGISALLANEQFALTVALHFIGLSPEKLSKSLYKNLIHSLRYRHIDANAWALSFFLMQEAYTKQAML